MVNNNRSIYLHPLPDETGQKVFVWPDGSWMLAHEYEDNLDSWEGDDFFHLTIPASITDAEDIDSHV